MVANPLVPLLLLRTLAVSRLKVSVSAVLTDEESLHLLPETVCSAAWAEINVPEPPGGQRSSAMTHRPQLCCPQTKALCCIYIHICLPACYVCGDVCVPLCEYFWMFVCVCVRERKKTDTEKQRCFLRLQQTFILRAQHFCNRKKKTKTQSKGQNVRTSPKDKTSALALWRSWTWIQVSYWAMGVFLRRLQTGRLSSEMCSRIDLPIAFFFFFLVRVLALFARGFLQRLGFSSILPSSPSNANCKSPLIKRILL